MIFPKDFEPDRIFIWLSFFGLLGFVSVIAGVIWLAMLFIENLRWGA